MIELSNSRQMFQVRSTQGSLEMTNLLLKHEMRQTKRA